MQLALATIPQRSHLIFAFHLGEATEAFLWSVFQLVLRLFVLCSTMLERRRSSCLCLTDPDIQIKSFNRRAGRESWESKLGPFCAASEFLKRSFYSSEVLTTFTECSSQGRGGMFNRKEYSPTQILSVIVNQMSLVRVYCDLVFLNKKLLHTPITSLSVITWRENKSKYLFYSIYI